MSPADPDSPRSPSAAPTRPWMCPRCGKPAPWKNNPWRPFCSERCKNIDLAAWADQDYKVPGDDLPKEGEEES